MVKSYELKGYVDADIKIDYVNRKVEFTRDEAKHIFTVLLEEWIIIIVIASIALVYRIINGEFMEAWTILLILLVIPICGVAVCAVYSHPKLNMLLLKLKKKLRKPIRIIEVWNPFKLEIKCSYYLAEIEYYGECANTIETVEWIGSRLKLNFSKPSEGYVKIQVW